MAQGTIDQLNFEAIIVDSRFNSTVEALNKTAEKMNVNLSSILDRLGRGGVQSFKNITSSVKETNAQLTGTTNILRTINMLTGYAFSAIGIKRFLSTMIDVTGQFEVQKMALRTMLQDAEAADKIFKDLYDFSSKSTYRFSELAKYSKQLAAFNIDKNSLLETTKMLGDVASGVGVSMDRLILAYGHVKSSGFLRGIQLRSFSQNGVPILEELSKMFTEIEGKAVSLGDVFDKMMKREIPFEMVEQAFKRMTSEGGKFYQMQETLAKTLAGQINILKGKWENMMYAIGNSESGKLKGAVKGLTWIVDHLEAIAQAIKPVIVGFGAYAAALTLVALQTKGAAIAKLAKDFLIVAKNVGIASAAVLTFGSAAKAAAVGLGIIVTVIAGVALAVRGASSDMDKFRKRLDEIHEEARNGNAYDREISNLERLRGIVNNSNLAYFTRKEALDQLHRMVPSYHAELTQEGKLIHDNTEELDAYNEALKRKAMLRGAEDELVELYNLRRAQVRAKQEAEYAQKNAKATPSWNIGGSITGAVYNYTGDMSAEAAKHAQEAADAQAKIEEVDQRIAGIMKEIDEAVASGQDSTNNMVYNISSIVTGIKNIDAELNKLRKKAKDKGISVAEKETLDQLKNAREEQTKLYKEIMGVDYDKDTRAGESAQAKALRERIAGIKAEIQVLQKYKQTYEALSQLVGADMAQGLTNEAYGVNLTNFDFTQQITNLANVLRSLGDEAGAESVMSSLGLGESKEIEAKLKKAQQIAKSYRTMMEAWDAKDMNADDDTFYGKLTKIISDLNTKSNEALLKFKKGKELLRGIDARDPAQKAAVIKGLMDEGMDEEAANEFWTTFVEKGEGALAELYEQNLAQLKTNAQKSVNALASTWVKQQTKDLSLTDWADKSIGQVHDLYKTLKALAEGEGIDEEMKQTLNKEGLAIEDFTKLTKEEFSKLTKEAKTELLKKFGAALKQFASDLGTTAQAVKEFASASGNEGLADTIEELEGALSIMSSVAERALQGDWIGAIVAGVTGVANKMFEAATAAAKFQAQLREAREESRKLQYEQALSNGVSSIFGKNEIQGIRNAKKNIESLQVSMTKRQRNEKGDWYVKSLKWMASDIGRDLYDEYGNLNADTLQTILNTYNKLSKEGKAWITEAINDSTEYREAMEQLNSTMESITGNIASSAADTIVDGWIEAKKAALDYTDILDDVAQSYSKMVIKSMIMDDVLNDDAIKALKSAFVSGDADAAMSLIEGKLQEIADLEPVIQQVLETFDPYYKREDSERTASSKAIQSNFSQDTIDYWSGQLTLLVQYARWGDEQRETLINLVSSLGDMSFFDPNYTANVQTYLASIQSDTSAIRGDIYAMKLAIQNMNDKGVKML